MPALVPLRESIDLEPRPDNAAAGRHFLRVTLTSWACDTGTVDTAVQVGAELLTNAILHAGTPFSLEVTYLDPVVRIAVRDYSPARPSIRADRRDAITGRGLGVVAALSRSWGVDPCPDGKVVWAEVADADDANRPVPRPPRPDPSERAALDPPRLARFPALAVHDFLAMQAHHDAMVRELELAALEDSLANGHSGTDRPHVVQLTRQVAPMRDGIRRAVEAAARRGEDNVDVILRMRATEIDALREWAGAMEDTEYLCHTGDLLTPPSTPEVAAVRRYLIEQLDHQLIDVGVFDQPSQSDHDLETTEALQLTLEHAPIGIAIVDLDGRWIKVNKALCEIVGYSEEELRAMTFADITHPDDLDADLNHVNELLAGGRGSYEMQKRYIHADGHEVPILLSVALVRDSAGHPLHFISQVQDTSERTRAAQALAQSEEQFRQAFDESTVGMAFTDSEGRFVRVNRALCDLLGRVEETLLQSRYGDVVHPDDDSVIADVIAGEIPAPPGPAAPVECGYVRGDGSLVWGLTTCWVRAASDGQPRRVMIEVQDVTAARRVSDLQLSLALDAAGMGAWDLDVATRAMRWTTSLPGLLGISPLVRPSIEAMLAAVDPPDADLVRAGIEEATVTGEAFDHDFRVLWPDGSVRWLLGRVQVARDDAGRASRIVGVVLDVTQRREVEESLSEERRTVETLHAVGTALVADLDLERIVQTVTDAATTLSGAAFGAFFYNVVHEGERYLLYALSGAAKEDFGGFPLPRPTDIFGPTFRGEQPIRLEDVTKDERYGHNEPYHGMPPGHLPVRSYLAVPVVSGSGEVIGGLFFGHPEPARFDERDERLVGGIAAQAAIAIDNARLYRSAQAERAAAEAAAERLARLQAATARLSDIRTMADVGTILLDELTSTVGADRSALWVLDRDGKTMTMVGQVNYSPELQARFARYRLQDASPAGEALTNGRPVTVHSRSERARHFPDLAYSETDTDLSHVLPLEIEGRPIGALAFSWREAPDLDEPQRRFMLAIGDQCAQALDRALLYTAERRAVRHQQFLADASRALAASLDFDATVERIARLAVPELADACSVMIIEDEQLRPVAHAAVDPVKEDLLRVMAERRDATDIHWLLQVAQTGEAVLNPVIDQSVLDEAALDDEHREHLHTLDIRSAMAVPMVARGHNVGLLGLHMTGDSGRQFSADDVKVVMDLGDRAAIAIDNARTFQLRSEVAETLQRSLLPPHLPAIPGAQLAARYQPALSGVDVGGDFYDVFDTGGDWALVLGDVCGKGAGAAALTAMARYSLRAAAIQVRQPAAVLSRLNEAILRQAEDERFCTVAYARLVHTSHGMRVTVSSAGHPLPLVVRADGTVNRLGGPGGLLGLFPEIRLVEETTHLAPGDALVLYTDGVTEAHHDRELFGDERLAAVLAAQAGRPAEVIANALQDAVTAFASGPRRDDLAVLVLRVDDN